jgi:2-dehydro-3-deoxyphosphogluconate aldolase/(4S)-4-hydroxy-2-oxoglutarate aldolase
MQNMEISEILHLSPVIPVVTISDPRLAVPLMRALIAGGITVIEVTLRTEAALDAIKVIAQNIPTAIIGAGTVIEPEQFVAAKAAGAHFIVSPGLTPPLMTAAKQIGLPYLPGAITPCEILAAKQMGFSTLKFFPAELAGGINMLKALAPVFSDVQFCPTGGITRVNMKDYLSLKNVIAVGGTWIAPKHLIEEKNWDAISALARAAL